MGGCLSKTPVEKREVLGCHVTQAVEQQEDTKVKQQTSATITATRSAPEDSAGNVDTELARPAAAADAAAAPPASGEAAHPAAHPAGIVVEAGGPSDANVAPAPVVETTVMQRVRGVLQGLTSIAADGSRGSLGQAAAVLLKQLQECGTDAVILTAAAQGSSVCVLAGCAGVGATTLQQQYQQLLLTDPKLSAALCSMQGEQQPYLYQTAAADELAPDWAALHKQHGLHSFLAMKVGGVGEAVGILSLASLKPSAFLELWWDPLLSMLSSGLVPLLGHPLMAGMCKVAHELEQVRILDPRAYTMLMLQRSTALLESITGMQLAVRLGLLSSDGQWLVVQYVTPGSTTTTTEENDMASGAAAAAAATGLLQQKMLPARDTIFCEAIAAQAPRLVADTSVYSQTMARPSADVFLGGDSEASLVVVPLQLGQDVPYKAALYVLQDKPGNFASCKRPICVLASILQLLLHKQLQKGGLLTSVWQDVDVQEGQQDSAQGQKAGLPSTPVYSQPSTASALVQMLQQQVRDNQQASQAKEAKRGGYLEDLQLNRVLGKGGFGVVYAGTWKGFPAAVKVMMVPKQARRVMKGAMEMAVQETLSHPNIVRVYAYLMDMVEEAVSPEGCNGSAGSYAGGASGSSGPMHSPALLRFRPAAPDDFEAGAISNIMIMEFCEGGTLASAVRAGLLHEKDMLNGRTVIRVSMWKLLSILVDVARSLEHVHTMSLLHCDLKPDNVLITTSPDSSLGMVAKLADFGLVKMMTNDRMYIRNQSVSGTITHLAPERFATGSRLTTAVDIYAFGMLMYEAYTRQRPFPNLHPASILQSVARGDRPEFPQGTPPPYRALAEACWAQEAQERPSASVAVQQLQDMLARTKAPSVLVKRPYTVQSN